MLNFDAAVHKHTLWTSWFRSSISRHSTLDAGHIEKDNCCDLGEWLHGEGRSSYGHLKGYASCVMHHAEFHREAARIARCINDRKYDEAERMLAEDSNFSRLSCILLGAFSALESEANS